MKEKKELKHRPRIYSAELRMCVIEEYLLGASRKELAEKYNIYNASAISHWVRKFKAYQPISKQKPMKGKHKKGLLTDSEKALERENAHLRKALAEKERELAQARLCSSAYQTMIQVAEKTFDIEIRKKSGPKQ